MHERKEKEMPKNDMRLLIYKILRYLYDCNKKGKIPNFSDMFKAGEMAALPQSYVAQILEELIDLGYIQGCTITVCKEATLIDLAADARITMKGVEFLTENSGMKKAAKAAKEFEVILEGILAAAL